MKSVNQIAVAVAVVGISVSSGFVAAQTKAPAVKSSTATQAKSSTMLKATMADVLKASQASDWRSLNPENTLYLEMDKGRVVIELAPEFAPKNVANIKALVKEGYFDGLAMIRSHDNYVAQWGDASEKREFKTAAKKVEGEFTIKYQKDTEFTRLPDADGYAPQVGHANSFAAARDPKTQTTWLTHCYGAIGVARGNETDSGNGSSLYAVTGHAPRNLDRNITVVGRVMYGIELLSSLPRGTGALGFYEKAEERTPIKTVRLAADVPEAERSKLEVFRTNTTSFKALVEAQRNRGGDWYKFAANHIELCNVPIPVRVVK
ncbi:peptidylprolyl isomerase [Undibacterium flavidum]|uniref:peptidylprolyl isomerase n=1 Tax=Undibacterium flavidum TaxID=2762297 RepID=A0ABR6YGK2_9BURK|nr:peptidylprolyl isomerase [Undibacterium flavidum]MBC3875643.1 peptidylprolyl isomerase [Undibacterium flavidum]